MPKLKTHSGAKKRFNLTKFADACSESATMEKAAKLEGRNMSIFLAPKAAK